MRIDDRRNVFKCIHDGRDFMFAVVCADCVKTFNQLPTGFIHYRGRCEKVVWIDKREISKRPICPAHAGKGLRNCGGGAIRMLGSG